MEYLFRDEQRRVKKRKKVAKSTLSFAVDGDGGEDDEGDNNNQILEEKSSKRPKTRKNPNVDTSFLPDRDREEAERREREELRQEWLRKQEEMKKEEIEITYSYWDGSGHRKSVSVGLVLSVPPVMNIVDGSDTRRTYGPVDCAVCSARKEMTLLRSLRSADSNFQSCGA